LNQEPATHNSENGHPVRYWPRASILEAWDLNSSLKEVANRCRLNAITAIQVAGSGHIGTSLSSLDIMVAVRRFLGGKNFLSTSTDRIFFSSKGHDAPAFYAVMHACGQLQDGDLFTLRRLGGLPGHPETITPGVATNTGSLGMGISKAKGFVKAQRLAQQDSRLPVVVMLGDGELNEGQIWESLPGAARDGFSELVAIVDANAIQSDTWTGSTLPMGDIRKRVEGSGWSFVECQGNDPDDVLRVLEESEESHLPTFIWAQTVKGSGISWMERFPENGEYYKFHSGAMDPVLYEEACSILINAVAGGRDGNAADVLPSDRPEFDALTPRARTESMLTLWERMLCDVMDRDERVVALDGDLSFDTGTHLARHLFPERYIQSGIAEQDMVSMAGTLALSGNIPFVHSFSTFLTMRATEQIFNNATEYSQIIYMGFLSGLVPSAPGFSHQAVTDVGIMSSIPGMRVFEPACDTELRWAVGQALNYKGPSFIRMGGLAPLSPAKSEGPWVERCTGSKVAFVSSGPLLTHQAVEARDVLHDRNGVRAALFSVAEITGDSLEKLADELEDYGTVFVLENHNPALAKYEILENLLGSKPAVRVYRLGLDGVPANGQPQEVLRYHGFDAGLIASSVVDVVGQ
jgi:transketolase